MKILVESQRSLPLTTVDVTIPGGTSTDPIGQEGLARHAVELMRRGAGGRTRAQLDEALDQIGASLDVVAGLDSVSMAGRCLSRNLPALMELLADCLIRPTMPTDEHEKLSRESLAMLDEIRDDDASLCARWFEKSVLAGHPYGRSGIGTATSIATIGRDDAARWVKERVVGGNLIVGFAGDVDEGGANALAARAFAGVPSGDGPALAALPPAPTRKTRRTVLVDKPEREQSQILFGHAAPAVTSPDFLPLHVGSTIFGGTFTSRLMTEVRSKRGWSYGASARVAKGRGAHTFRMRVFPAAAQTPDTIELVLELWQELAKNGVTPEEVAFAKSYLDGSWAFEIDTAPKRLDHRVDGMIWGLPEEAYTRHRERLAAVTVDQVNAALARWMKPAEATIVCTCTAETMRPRLEGKTLGEIDVVPYESY